MQKTFLTNKKLLHQVQAWIKNVLDNKVNEDKLLNVIIVINEVIQNIYRYTYNLSNFKKIQIQVDVMKEDIIFLIKDFGSPCINQEFLIKEKSISEDGGMGLKIIFENTELFEINPKKNGNLTLVKLKK